MNVFSEGVTACGDQVIQYWNSQLPTQPLDAGFVLGYTLENNFRKKIIDCLTAQHSPVIFVDSNILHYARPAHEWHRYSMHSVYPNTGQYFFKELDYNKWAEYSHWHGVGLQSWRQTGKHILLLCQRPKGWNMFGENQDQWLNETVDQIHKITPRPIVVRMHPGDGTRFEQIAKIKKRWGSVVAFSNNANIKDDLVNCWASVGYNSTPNVVSAIQGVPVCLADPTHSWAADVAFTSIKDIETPLMPDRSQWIHKIANIHWSNQEVKSGKLWEAIRCSILTARR